MHSKTNFQVCKHEGGGGVCLGSHYMKHDSCISECTTTTNIGFCSFMLISPLTRVFFLLSSDRSRLLLESIDAIFYWLISVIINRSTCVSGHIEKHSCCSHHLFGSQQGRGGQSKKKSRGGEGLSHCLEIINPQFRKL